MRAVCYCGDCRAYAHVLGQPDRVLDTLGGTDVVATDSRYVRFTSGKQSLACLSLSPGGLLRWYAGCCNTPIANTPRNWKLPYVGLVHTCLNHPQPMTRSFPEVRMRVFTRKAKGRPPRFNPISAVTGFTGLMLRLTASRLRGGYRGSPFFDENGVPATDVVVATRDAVEQARRAAQ